MGAVSVSGCPGSLLIDTAAIPSMIGTHHNTAEWLRENEKFFLPPVCNKMMHNDQLKVFYVGGPNQRADFHLEEGEELFYMRRGSMTLPILTQGRIRTVTIKQGEVFLLPARIPHSPQREADTVGLVVERDRLDTETDGLRYFVDGTTEVLFERWFHCENLGSQLKPLIEEFFASEECKTGKPGAPCEASQPAWEPDSVTEVESPFNLQDWLDSNRRPIRSSGSRELFPSQRYQSDILVLGLGQGSREIQSNTETFLWQLEGSSTIHYGEGLEVKLKRDETVLLPGGGYFTYSPSPDSMTLSCVMDPANRGRPPCTE